MEQFLSAIDWKQVLNVLISWLLFSIGLWTVLGKLRWKKRWMAWVPGLRYIALSEVLDMEREGLVYSQRGNGRYITEDTAAVARVRDALAAGHVRRYREAMRGLGYSDEEMKALLSCGAEEDEDGKLP